MNWLRSFVIALLTGALGLFCSGFLGRAYAEWFQRASAPLTKDYTVFFCALVGGAASLVIGLVIARISRFPFIRTLACAWTAVFAISGGVLWTLWTRADFPKTPEAQFARPSGKLDVIPPMPPKFPDTAR